jgi:hypothetical protein
MGLHHVMDHTGHSTIEFDPKNEVDLAAAMARFNELVVEKGFRAATRSAPGAEPVVIKTFDPDVYETLFFPQYRGG